MCLDLVVHGWDVATAVGMPHTIDAEEIARIRNDTGQLGEAMRAPNVIGAPVTPPADADEQEKLLAFLGRDPRPATGPPA